MTTEPTVIRAGDSAEWTRCMSQFPASAGWALAYRLVPRTGGCAVDIAATADVDGDGFTVTLAATATQEWAPGEYTLVGVMTEGARRSTVYAGSLTVAPNLMDVSEVDTRSRARQIVEAIDKYFATGDLGVLERQHADRTLRFRSHAELVSLRSFYAGQVAGEDAAERLAEGLGTGARVQVRM